MYIVHILTVCNNFPCRTALAQVSGRRFWGLWQRLGGTPGPDRVFRHVFVHNLCPLAFMASSGKNVTPNCLSAPLRQQLESVCQRALVEIIQVRPWMKEPGAKARHFPCC